MEFIYNIMYAEEGNARIENGLKRETQVWPRKEFSFSQDSEDPLFGLGFNFVFH